MSSKESKPLLNIQIEDRGDEKFIFLSGTINENVDLFTAIGVPETKMKLVFSCAEITRINSVGAKIWVKYFSLIKSRGLKFEFEKLSPFLVDLLCSISNFNLGAPVRSVQLPYQCKACAKFFTHTATLKECATYIKSVPNQPCPNCKETAFFDEIPEDYFQFLKGI